MQSVRFLPPNSKWRCFLRAVDGPLPPHAVVGPAFTPGGDGAEHPNDRSTNRYARLRAFSSQRL